MISKIKNIIIFAVIVVALILVYVFFIKKSPEEANLISSSVSPLGNAVLPDQQPISAENSSVAKDFLSVLLNVKSVKLDGSIFSDPAFMNLSDSSILLVPDGNEGRPNPFAPIGSENATVAPPAPAKSDATPAALSIPATSDTSSGNTVVPLN